MFFKKKKKKRKKERKKRAGLRAGPQVQARLNLVRSLLGALTQRERSAALPHATCPEYCFESNYVKLEMKYSERSARRDGCMQVSGISSSRGNSITIVTCPASGYVGQICVLRGIRA